MAILREMKKSLADVSTYVSDLDREELIEEDAQSEDINQYEEKKGGNSIRCASVDNFQGEESDIVVICLV